MTTANFGTVTRIMTRTDQLNTRCAATARHISLLLLVFTPLLLHWAPAVGGQEVPELQVNSKRYIVIDADTGEIFAQKNAHDEVAIASLTKIFTSIIAIEQADSSMSITTTEADLQGPEASVMGFGPGETFTLDDLLHGLMLPSGNDAAYAIARSIGYQPGDDDATAVQRFVDHANQRIDDMGLTETHLMRPDGWGVPGHFSSAHDLAAFTRFALRYPRFVQLISSKSYETASGYYLVNNNRLLNSYDDLLGGKTGYDNDAGWCLVEVAERNGDTMISVTLDGIAPDDWYDDNRVLLNYAFDQKASRRASGLQLAATADVVRFKDPDAAVIARNADFGMSFGAAAAGSFAKGGGSTSPLASRVSDVTGSSPISAPGTDAYRRQLVAAFAVAATLMLVRVLATVRKPVHTPPISQVNRSTRRHRRTSRSDRSGPSADKKSVPPGRSSH